MLTANLNTAKLYLTNASIRCRKTVCRFNVIHSWNTFVPGNGISLSSKVIWLKKKRIKREVVLQRQHFELAGYLFTQPQRVQGTLYI